MNKRLHINREHLIEQLEGMLRIRRLEEKCAELYATRKDSWLSSSLYW